MELERALTALTQRVADMGEAITMKSSVQSAQAGRKISSRNNQLQALAVVLALFALILSIYLNP